MYEVGEEQWNKKTEWLKSEYLSNEMGKKIGGGRERQRYQRGEERKSSKSYIYFLYPSIKYLNNLTKFNIICLYAVT